MLDRPGSGSLGAVVRLRGCVPNSEGASRPIIVDMLPSWFSSFCKLLYSSIRQIVAQTSWNESVGGGAQAGEDRRGTVDRGRSAGEVRALDRGIPRAYRQPDRGFSGIALSHRRARTTGSPCRSSANRAARGSARRRTAVCRLCRPDPVPHRHRHGTVQLDYGAWDHPHQEVVEVDDQGPVRRGDAGSLRVDRRDGRLDSVRAEPPRPQRTPRERRPSALSQMRRRVCCGLARRPTSIPRRRG